MNLVVLVGRLSKDPELRYLAGEGTPVATFQIAVNRPYAKEGQQQADFFKIVVWGKRAENCATFLSKGKQVAITGEIQNRAYEKDGEKRYITEIKASNVEFLSPKSEATGAGAGSQKTFEPTGELDGFEELADDEIPF